MGKENQGFATLGVALLILVILSGVTLFTAKNLLIDKRVVANEGQSIIAFAYAEAGLETAARQYFDDPEGFCDDDAEHVTPLGMSESVNIETECRDSNQIVMIAAEYISEDGLSRAYVEQAYYHIEGSGSEEDHIESNRIAGSWKDFKSDE